jgi:hypothetical protein
VVHRSYKARKSSFEMAEGGGAAACTPPCTMLAQEGASLGRGRLLGGGVSLGPVPPDRPATPVEGEAGGRGCAPAPLLASRCRPPGEGEAGRREGGIRTGGGVDRLCCWVSTLLVPPPPRLGGGGGAASRGGARVRPRATGGEVRTPWWLTANSHGG